MATGSEGSGHLKVHLVNAGLCGVSNPTDTGLVLVLQRLLPGGVRLTCPKPSELLHGS